VASTRRKGGNAQSLKKIVKSYEDWPRMLGPRIRQRRKTDASWEGGKKRRKKAILSLSWNRTPSGNKAIDPRKKKGGKED